MSERLLTRSIFYLSEMCPSSTKENFSSFKNSKMKHASGYVKTVAIKRTRTSEISSEFALARHLVLSHDVKGRANNKITHVDI